MCPCPCHLGNFLCVGCMTEDELDDEEGTREIFPAYERSHLTAAEIGGMLVRPVGGITKLGD